MDHDTHADNDNRHPLVPPERALRPNDPAIRRLTEFLDEACAHATRASDKVAKSLGQIGPRR